MRRGKMASSPEPPPVKRGVEVTPLLLEWLEKEGASDHVKELIRARHEYGLKKYGQGLMSEDGRGTMEDARQEAGDLLQYLFKAIIQQRVVPSVELDQLEAVLDHCRVLIELLRND
jgi:hypothetical protein